MESSPIGLEGPRDDTGRPRGSHPRRHRRRRVVALLVAVLTLTAGPGGALTTHVSAAPVGVDPDGRWSALENWPLIAIHAALTPNGEVVTYGTTSTGRQSGLFIYDVWDPRAPDGTPGSAGTGHLTLPNETETDLFCSIQLVRPDSGELVLFGGDTYSGATDQTNSLTTNDGNPDINVYDPADHTLSPAGTMLRPRWYATAITLGDGSIYLQGGLGSPEEPGNDIAEHWTEETGSVELPFSTTDYDYWYPRLFLIPDGRIFGFDVRGKMFYVSADLQQLTSAGQLPSANRGIGSSAVMFAPGQILQFGGNSDTAVIIDATGASPTVTPTGSLSSRRDWGEGVLLPDGRVLAVGGSEATNQLVGVNLAAEIWDPATGVWTLGGEGAVARLYHSTALLLPDGRVLVAGGGAPGPIKNTNAEIYAPDYLVAADGSDTVRPVITAMSDTSVEHGDDLSVSVDDTARAARVTLLKTGSVTHSFNVEQRILDLPFTAVADDGQSGPGTVAVTIPADRNLVTPGYYLVTVLDADGIPSSSEILQVRATPPPPPPPPPVVLPGGAATVESGEAGDPLPGETVVSIPVTLSAPSSEEVRVQWRTLDVPDNPIIAVSTADYRADSGELVFPPGVTDATVDITVLDDPLDEDDEWIAIATSDPVNATIGGFWGLGFGLILDDDAPPIVALGAATVDEPAPGETGVAVSLPVTLSAPSSKTVSLSWRTFDIPDNDTIALSDAGTAAAPEGAIADHLGATGIVTFTPGETTASIPVTVLADPLDAPNPDAGDEWLVVAGSAPVNATLGGFWGLGLARIRDWVEPDSGG